MRISLRLRVLILVFGINALLFGAGGVYLADVQQRESERAERGLADDLLYTLSRSIRPEKTVQSAALLSWPSWAAFDDALLVQYPFTGVRINPLGRVGRAPDFDEGAVEEALQTVARTKSEVVDVLGGRVVPIQDPNGKFWGACWYRRAAPDRADSFLSLV